MMFLKQKPVKLEGKEYQKLRKAIFERDEGRCVICGRKATEHHHEPPGKGRRSDTIYTGVALCEKCHWERHNGKNSILIKNKINDYLNQMYGEKVRKEYVIL